jgi:hypothetical protein
MIRSVKGDIWDFSKTHLIVVPVNIGWKGTDHRNVMGRGLALQAVIKYPRFSQWYGLECKKHGAATSVMLYPYAPLIAFPTKPLNESKPWMSWQSKSDLGLIERSSKELATMKLDKPVAMSAVGCGNGGLDMADVRPILDRHLSDERFTLILL